MPRFFSGEICKEAAFITGEDARHIALSLRMKAGEAVTVCDSAGSDYHCVIRDVTPERVTLAVQDVAPSAGEPARFITLYQALPKGDKMEQIIQKSVELGVGRIVPMLTKRCVSRPDEKAMAKKIIRYRKIALEAAKQCGRGRVPDVAEALAFEDAVLEAAKAGPALLFYENAQGALRQVLPQPFPDTISIFIGSEGGFEPSEAAFVQAHGLIHAPLGARILRCETAPAAALSILLYHAGEI